MFADPLALEQQMWIDLSLKSVLNKFPLVSVAFDKIYSDQLLSEITKIFLNEPKHRLERTVSTERH